MNVRFTEKELEGFKQILELISEIKNRKGGDSSYTRMLKHFVEKMEKARVVKKPSGAVTVSEFLTQARLILGPRLKEQVSPTGAWYKQMQNRLDSRNISKGMAAVAIETARDSWAGDIWIDQLIMSTDKLAVMTPKNVAKSKLGWIKRLEGYENKAEETE